MTKLPLALALLAVTAPALARDRGIPAATPLGKPVDCLFLSQIRQTSVRSDQVIDFRTTGGKTYRNTLPQSCPSLGFEQRFAYKVSTGQLCSVDIITVLNGNGIQSGASCGLGHFQPVELARTAR